MTNQTCKNCHVPLVNEEKYCPACGQKATVEALTWHALGHELIHYFTHAEKNIFSLILQLTLRPGVVAREYLSGKRKKYFSPVNFFLIVAGFLAIVVSSLHTFEGAFLGPHMEEANKSNFLLHALSAKLNWIFFLLVPVFALLYHQLFFRRSYNYIEHLAISLYWQGYLLLITALILAPIAYTMDPIDGVGFVFMSFFILQCVYYAFAYYQLFERKGILYFLLYLLLSFVALIVIMLLGFLFLRLVILVRSYYH